MMMQCCTANCCQALYYAWEGILRQESHDSVTVNLWLNRRSPWVDVLSWQPYEGKLTVQNKGMRRIAIRKPGWAAAASIRCQVNGIDAKPSWNGNRMIFNGLKGNELISIHTQLFSESAEYTLVNIGNPIDSTERYQIEFKGPTATKVDRVSAGDGDAGYYKGQDDHDWYRLFLREHMRADHAPMHPSPSYVHGDRLIRWTVV